MHKTRRKTSPQGAAFWENILGKDLKVGTPFSGSEVSDTKQDGRSQETVEEQYTYVVKPCQTVDCKRRTEADL